MVTAFRKAAETFLLTALLIAGDARLCNFVQAMEVDREKLMIVLRESIGANKQDDALKPSGKVTAKLPDGKEVEVNLAWFDFIGDMHIRFVIDEPATMRGVTSQQFAALNLSPEDAVRFALGLLERSIAETSARDCRRRSEARRTAVYACLRREGRGRPAEGSGIPIQEQRESACLLCDISLQRWKMVAVSAADEAINAGAIWIRSAERSVICLGEK